MVDSTAGDRRPQADEMATTNAEYNRFPDRYIDAIDSTDNYFLPVWQEIADHLQGKQVADIGCGSGHYTACLIKAYGCRLVGIDGSAYALSKASDKGFSDVHQVVDLGSDRLPLASSSQDVAINKDVLEHLVDPMHLLREIARILRPDGLLLLHVPNHFPLTGRMRFLVTGNIDPFGFCLGAKAWELPHIRFFSFEDIKQMLAISGFRVVMNLSHHFPAIPWLHRMPARLHRRMVEILTGRYTTLFCCGFTVLAQKIPTDQPVESVA